MEEEVVEGAGCCDRWVARRSRSSSWAGLRERSFAVGRREALSSRSLARMVARLAVAMVRYVVCGRTAGRGAAGAEEAASPQGRYRDSVPQGSAPAGGAGCEGEAPRVAAPWVLVVMKLATWSR